MRFVKVAKAFYIGERIDRKPDGTETREPAFYPLEAFLDEYVWVDDRWSNGSSGEDAEAWAMAFDRLTDALVPDLGADGRLGKLAEGSEIAIEPADWLKLRLVATSVTRLNERGQRVDGVDPRIARLVRKAHQNAIILARSGPAPAKSDEEEKQAPTAPS